MRCPVCKADNETGPTCRRCKADLSMLWDLEAQRAHGLARVAECLRRGEVAAAKAHVVEADAIRSDGDSRRLLAVAHLLAREFEDAWRLTATARRAGPS